jgi:hypothetical protein
VAGIIATMSVASGMAVRGTSASVVAAATSSSAAAMGGTAATAAVAATTPAAVVPMRGSSHRGSRVVGCWLVFSMDTIASAICWGAAATSGFVVSSGSDFVVDPHEVGVLGKLGDDFTCAVSLGLSCYHGDRHKAFLRGRVHLVGDLIQSLIEVLDGESFLETSASIDLLSVAVAPSVLVFGSLVGGALADSSSSQMPSRYRSAQFFEVPASPATMKTSWSGVQRLESIVATSVGVCSSSFGASDAPPGRGVSRGRRRSVSCRQSGLRACGRASRRICQRE